MVPGWLLAGLSYRAAFVLSAVLLAASLVLTILAAVLYPNVWPLSGFLGLTVLLALTTCFTGWMITQSDAGEERPGD